MPYNRKAFSDDYATETFYFPLSVQVEDEDSENLYNVSSDSVRWFEDEIQEAIDDYQSDIEMEKYLCDDNDEVRLDTVSENCYTLYSASKDVYFNTDHVSLSDIFDTKLISEKMYNVIITAINIRRLGLEKAEAIEYAI